MKIFIDTANLDMIKEINSWGILDGVTTNPSLIAKEGVDVRTRVKEIAEVVNMSTIKPLDSETLVTSVSKTGCCVTAEEHSIIGGLGSAVAECLSSTICAPLERVGTKDTFGESGKPADLMVKYGLTADDIAAAARKSISRKA